ncbi:VanZ family protein [Paenibacillus typhae]|uniref:VanZ like family protein n=1 Tax=Paenibacillus typhae TaxID=1174501 RepID=A0A1G8XJ82_9BACL|nr:VanZ family protein [Paenibacillus typhae]SDJ90546.1 VanZ like family protein [Paenibacillus typhae]
MKPISRKRVKRRGRHSSSRRHPRPAVRFFVGLVLLLYSGAVLYWMFLGFGRTVRTEGPLLYNLEPLRTVKLYFDLDNGVSLTGRLVNLAGNVIVFVPFGLLLPLVQERFRSPFILTLWTIFYILLLETLQMVLRVGSFDVDDLLLNLIGVWSGLLLLRITSILREA